MTQNTPLSLKAALLATVMGFAAVTAPTAAETDVPEPPEFTAWLAVFKAEAMAEGIPAELLEVVFAGMEPNPRVIELDRRQPEFTLTFDEYINTRVSDTRTERGIEKKNSLGAKLNEIGDKYGVDPNIMLGIWGMESNYGRNSGKMSVVRGLMTLAWDPRRSNFFRSELLKALKILNDGHIEPENMLGSWAGAMGQGQFMPSSFLDYAQDYDGDGRADIWTNEADVLASMANYLSRYRYDDKKQPWGFEVTVPDNFASVSEGFYDRVEKGACSRAMKQHSMAVPLSAWRAMGLEPISGEWPETAEKATLVRPGGEGGRAFLTFENYRTILRYNCSNYYAIAVSLLSDRVRNAAVGE